MTPPNSSSSSDSSDEPRIPPAEWQVMEVLWNRAPRATGEVVHALQPTTGWKPQTIHTLLRRLTDKGLVAVEKSGREHRYHPTVERSECALAQSRELLERLFGGRVTPLLAAMVDHDDLGSAEIAELRALVERLEDQDSKPDKS